MRFWLSLLFLSVSLLIQGQDFPLVPFQTFRAEEGRSFPSWDGDLAASCASRSQELALSGEISHWDDRGWGAGHQLVARGFAPGVFGEIIGAGGDPLQVWRAWLKSPTHRAVLVDARWKRWGWGASRLGNTTVWVVRFWAP